MVIGCIAQERCGEDCRMAKEFPIQVVLYRARPCTSPRRAEAGTEGAFFDSGRFARKSTKIRPLRTKTGYPVSRVARVDPRRERGLDQPSIEREFPAMIRADQALRRAFLRVADG